MIRARDCPGTEKGMERADAGAEPVGRLSMGEPPGRYSVQAQHGGAMCEEIF